ncbi:MAG TPA: hypothetical protein VHE53_00530 [Patescibacteria group bacterium]|nr:hypothetical protein [Patescibacteria group bacterium]
MEKIKTINPKILLIIFLFLITVILMAFLSLLIGPKRSNKTIPESLTPTPVQEQIPEDAEIPTPIIQNPASVITNNLGQVSFSVLNLSIPKEMNIYSAEPAPIDQTTADSIAQKLGIETKGKITTTTNGDAMSFSDKSINLIFYLTSGNTQYFNSLASTNQTQGKNLNDLQNTSKNFMDLFSPLSDGLIIDEKNTSFITGSGDTESVPSFDQATIINIPFIQTVDGLPLYSQFGSNTQGSVSINKNGQILRVILNTKQILLAKKSIPTLTLDAAKKAVINGNAVIAKYGTDNEVSLPNPQSTLFTKVSLGYLRDTTAKLLYPIFIFEGVATTGGQNYPITIYLTAYATN